MMFDRYSSFSQAGFSLVELMVALTLGLVLLAGVTTVATNTGQSHRQVIQTSQQLENGRYATEVLKEDLRHAGFFGEFYQLPALPAALPDPCDVAAASFANGFPLAIQGYDDPTASPLGCIDNGNYVAGTDVLVIRRADITPTALADVNPGRVYVQTRNDSYVLASCSSSTACSGKASSGTVSGAPVAVFNLTKKDGVTLADIRAQQVHIYFIRPWSDAAGDGIPSLARVVLDDGGIAPQMTTEPLVEGIENMQIQYGIDDGVPTGTPNDGAPDRYVDAPANIGEWANVVAVRLNLLARQTTATMGYTDAKTYDLGETGITPGGGYKRRVFSAVVRLMNVGARRES